VVIDLCNVTHETVLHQRQAVNELTPSNNVWMISNASLFELSVAFDVDPAFPIT
jgi:hypothetical protein